MKAIRIESDNSFIVKKIFNIDENIKFIENFPVEKIINIKFNNASTSTFIVNEEENTLQFNLSFKTGIICFNLKIRNNSFFKQHFAKYSTITENLRTKNENIFAFFVNISVLEAYKKNVPSNAFYYINGTLVAKNSFVLINNNELIEI